MNRPYCVACDGPKVGQVWQDNDPRGGPRVRIEQICDGSPGSCQPLSSSERNPHAHVTTDGKRPRTILLRRFKPGRNGYTLKERTL